MVRSRKAWKGVSATAVILLIVASLVLTQIIPGTMDLMFGGTRMEISGTSEASYTASEGVTDKETALAAANEVNLEINEEGIILLKNDDSVLPLAEGAKVSVFGKNSVDLAYGSSGSVGGTSTDAPTIFDSLESADFEYNTVLREFYEDDSLSGSGRPSSPSMLSGSIVTGFETGETPVSSYTDDVLESFEEYHDAALVVITRVSGENYDLPTTMYSGSEDTPVEGAASADDHYLELDQNEQEMLQLACENFDTVILVLNSATPIELGFLDGNNGGDETMLDYDFASGVQAALWIGMSGETGIYALGEVLSGEVNPSGKTVDTYARDFMTIPAVANYSCNGEANTDSYTLNGSTQNEYFIDYEEGIYVGYRYFETRGADDEEWYEENVVYAFGYGLSYTTFSQEIVESDIDEESAWSADGGDTLSITVSVTNTGSVAGKDVIELYATAPYYTGEIEKSEVVLIGFAKTDNLEPGETQEYTITFEPYDFASYDYTDANGNGHAGYELDAGDYVFSIRSDAHTVLDSVTTTLNEAVIYETDTTTGYEVTNRFDDTDDQLGSVLSRADWEGTWPSARTEEEKQMESYDGFQADLNSTDSGNPLQATDDIVVSTNAERPPATAKSADGMQLSELVGLDYEDDAWNQILSRITLSSIWDTLSDAAFKTNAIDYIGKPSTIESDGPSGYTKFLGDTSTIYDTCFYCSECVVAATWNTELAYKMGIALGDEGLIGDEANGQSYSGIYAPATNLHRTPFGGRNPEYYSEDSCLSGAMAAQVVAGASERGVYCYVKHFAVNDQETHRGGVCTWVTEQALRELYLKPFETTVKEGGATAIMSSFNRIGSTWTGGSYALITEVLRNEWGFEGTVICDFATGQSHMNFKQQIYAGADLWLDTIAVTSWYDKENALDVYVLQESMKHVLYTIVNSNAFNLVSDNTTITLKMAYWRMVLIAVDVLIPLLLILWGFFVYRKPKKVTAKAGPEEPSGEDLKAGPEGVIKESSKEAPVDAAKEAFPKGSENSPETHPGED